MEELTNTIEIVCNEKTYVSKKMNPIRRSLIIKNIVGTMSGSKAQKDVDSGVQSMENLFSTNLPETMWAFVKDEDKKDIGEYKNFVEELDDKNCLEFLEWAMNKVNEVNDFLAKGKEAATT